MIVPSTIKKKPTKAKRAAKVAPLKIRRLAEGEVAYRFTWIDKGQTVTNELTDLKAVNELIHDALPGMKLLKVETLDFDSSIVETLHKVE